MSAALQSAPPPRSGAYFHAPDFVRAANPLSPDESVCFLGLPGAGGGAPLVRAPLGGGRFDLRTPAGFAGPDSPDALIEAWPELSVALAEAGCVSAYLQCRGPARRAPDAPLIDRARYRTVFLLDLDRDFEAIRAACRRDTRQRVNQILRAELAESHALSADFCRFYSLIAARNGFPPLYDLSAERFAALAAAPGVHYYELREAGSGAFVAGGFLGACGDTADYLYAAYNPLAANAGRVAVVGAIRRAQALGFARLNLGGGIAEDDSLADFKASFGAAPERWSAIRAVIDPAAAAALAGEPPGPAWFEGFFPKYRRA